MFIVRYVKQTTILTAIMLALAVNTPLYADDDPSDTCAAAAELFTEGDIEGALEEARWCVTQLEQLKKSETSAFFKDEIDGYEGGELNSQQAMGITVIARSYGKSNQFINVSLTGGASGGANNAFAALASLGMQAAQGEKIRIQRRTAMLTNDGGTVELVVTLKSGGMLTFESDDVSSDALVAFAKEFPVAELDDSIE